MDRDKQNTQIPRSRHSRVQFLVPGKEKGMPRMSVVLDVSTTVKGWPLLGF